MAGACIKRLYHRHPSCMSEHKSLQVFKNDDGTFSGYCFSCGRYVSNPLGEISEEDAEKKKTARSLQKATGNLTKVLVGSVASVVGYAGRVSSSALNYCELSLKQYA